LLIENWAVLYVGIRRGDGQRCHKGEIKRDNKGRRKKRKKAAGAELLPHFAENEKENQALGDQKGVLGQSRSKLRKEKNNEEEKVDRERRGRECQYGEKAKKR